MKTEFEELYGWVKNGTYAKISRKMVNPRNTQKKKKFCESVESKMLGPPQKCSVQKQWLVSHLPLLISQRGSCCYRIIDFGSRKDPEKSL